MSSLPNDSLINIRGMFVLPNPLPECKVCGAEEDNACTMFNPATGFGEELGSFIHACRLETDTVEEGCR